ncbi:glycosyltransferase [Synechococcus sp. RedBA-s]|uniref:glycosyltransferase n=1 Tax=Synechococcus sp. RedBA-s TaxID=2823741 RepID=UPI0020CE5ADE|nr:glycosyltransferase [Synechococcus sp. RedBA-s]MCP9799192.1 glycosyltransferase [Synechococcus sp. RedBA-s]
MTLILLLGMHRSGTSLLGSLLAGLGVPLPGRLIAGDQYNPGGYYEREDTTAIQEQLLRELGRCWPTEAGLLPLPDGWLELPSTVRARNALQQLLKGEKDLQTGPWAIKDPRISLLLPLWRQLAEQLSLPLRLVISVRNPAEVMVSLLERDSQTAGMTPWRAQRLWWQHNRQALLDAGDLPLLALDYGAWFEPSTAERQLRVLAAFCGIRDPIPTDLERLRLRIRPGYRRSRHDAATLPLPVHPRLRQFQRNLSELAGHDCDALGLQALRRWLKQQDCHPLPELPPHGGSLRSRLIAARARRAPQCPTGGWFDEPHYRAQVPALPADHPPLLHYWWRGWREHRSPHPLFDPGHYEAVCRSEGLTPTGAPLHHFLTLGLARGLSPCPLADPAWARAAPQRWALWRAAQLDGMHPWGAAALALSGGQLGAAIERLQGWLRHGLDPDTLTAIRRAEPADFALVERLLPDFFPLPSRCRLVGIGTSPSDWRLHAWLQRCPLPDGFSLLEESEEETGAGRLALVLEPVPAGPASLELISLAHLAQVWAPDADTVELLRRLGVNARQLDADVPANGWLQQAGDGAAASLRLGLPDPAALVASSTCPAGNPAGVLCLGSAGEAWERQLRPPVWAWPAFDQVVISEPEEARLLTSWLNACSAKGLQLVRLQPSEAERHSRAWHALARPRDPAPGWLPAQAFMPPLSPPELLEELNWRACGRQPPVLAPTPRPEVRQLWNRNSPQPVTAAVCISLYNYGDRITTALESVFSQTHPDLELIVVDDASGDGGAQTVIRWLEEKGSRFPRALLLQHESNGGLAASRNTAFAAAAAPWCFVLDADNRLEPEAVALTLSIATAAPAAIAVVHPLLEVVASSERPDEQRTLMTGRSWQRTHFKQGNHVDAMALVRRSAWEQVGGYRHIPGGWEDYDFWCSLIEAGFEGVLCPQRLATYYSHGSSMLATETNRQRRAVARQLQQLHPWLTLPLAQATAEVTL